MQHEATLARPPRLLESGLLFARRHKAIAAAAITIAVSVLLVAAISSVFTVRLSNEVKARSQAEAEILGERDKARWEAYIARVAGALSARATGEFGQMRHHLASTEYAGKGWEWNFLVRQAQRSTSNTQAHEGMIFDVAFGPDAQRFATSASDGTVRLWNTSDRSLLAAYANDSHKRTLALGFTADGSQLVTGDIDGVVHILDTESVRENLREIRAIDDRSSGVRSISGLPDGRVLIARTDGTATLLSSFGVEPLQTDQPGGIHGASCSADDKLLATYNDDGQIWIRDAATFALLLKLEFPGPVNQVRFSNDSQRVAAAGGRSQVLVWNLPGGEPEPPIQAANDDTSVRSLAFSPDGAMLAVGLTHRGIVVFSVPDNARLGEFGGHTEGVSALRFLDDGRTLLSASWDRTIRTWSAAEIGSPSGTTSLLGHRDHVMGVKFSPVGSRIASASRDGTVRIWDPDLARVVAVVSPGTSALTAVAYSPDGMGPAVGSADGYVRIIDTRTREVQTLEPRFDGPITSIAFDPNGNTLAAGGECGTIRTWDIPSRKLALEWRAHASRVLSVCFSPDSAILASASRDGTARMWNTATWVEIPCEAQHDSDVFAVLFSHDGNELFTGSRDQTIGVWDVATGSNITALSGHGQFVTCLALNPDGSRLAAGSWFGEIVLFDVTTRDLIASFRAHDSAIRGIDFSSDGRWLASGSLNSTVRLFDSYSRAQADAARATAELASTAPPADTPPG